MKVTIDLKKDQREQYRKFICCTWLHVIQFNRKGCITVEGDSVVLHKEQL